MSCLASQRTDLIWMGVILEVSGELEDFDGRSHLHRGEQRRHLGGNLEGSDCRFVTCLSFNIQARLHLTLAVVDFTLGLYSDGPEQKAEVRLNEMKHFLGFRGEHRSTCNSFECLFDV